jgi:hypothetical protein
MWAPGPILGGAGKWGFLMEVPSEYLPEVLFIGRGNFLEIFKMQERFPFNRNLEESKNGSDESFHTSFTKPKSPGLVGGPEHTCSV